MKRQGPVEDFLDDICYPNRDTEKYDADQVTIGAARDRECQAIWDDMKCDPKHWEQRTRDIVEQVDLEPVYEYIINQLNREHIAHICALYSKYHDSIGEEFISHLSDECDWGIIGKLIKKAVDEAVEEVL